MSEEKILEPNKVFEQLVKDGIKEDCGIHRYLYHGTSKDIAQKILSENEIITGDNVGYLGIGFYCYYLDIEASRIWARKKISTEKNNNKKIAVLVLVANLGNLFFISKELNINFKDLAKEHIDFSSDINITVGFIVERIIKEFIKPRYDIDIQTVGRYHIHNKNKKPRPVLIFSLRDKLMINKIELCWEEQ